MPRPSPGSCPRGRVPIGRSRDPTLTQALQRLQGSAIPASILERDVLPARVQGFRSADLDASRRAASSSGSSGALGTDDGRVMLLFREGRRRSCRSRSRPAGPVHDAIRTHLADRGASFWPDLVQAAGTADTAVLLRSLWDLVWAGEVTNDTLTPLRAFARSGRRRARTPARPGTASSRGTAAGAGRWSLVADLRTATVGPTDAPSPAPSGCSIDTAS